MRRATQQLSYANVMSTIAVFIALGGTSYAAVQLGRGAVKNRNIASNAVTGSKVKNGSLTLKDFKKGQIPKRIKGAAGPAGPIGATGAPGSAGATGATGAQGDTGAAPLGSPIIRQSRNVESDWAIANTPTLVVVTDPSLASYSGEYSSVLTHPAGVVFLSITALAHVEMVTGANVTCSLQHRVGNDPFYQVAEIAVPASAPREATLAATLPSFSPGSTHAFRLMCKTTSGMGTAHGSIVVIAGSIG